MSESFNKVVTEALMSKEEVTFTDRQETMINEKLGRARFEHTKRMLRAQRDGKRRLQLQRQKVLNKNANNEEDVVEETEKQQDKPKQKVNVMFNSTKQDSLKNAPAKAKLKRTKKLQKAQAKAMKAELRDKTVFEVDGDGNPYDKVQLHLTDVPHDAEPKNLDEK